MRYFFVICPALDEIIFYICPALDEIFLLFFHIYVASSGMLLVSLNIFKTRMHIMKSSSTVFL